MRVRLGDRVGGVDRGRGRGRGMDMDRLHRVGGVDVDRFMWDNCWSYGNNGDHGGSYDGAERRALGRCCTGLVRPGVVGEPLGRDEVLTGGVCRVHIAPLSSGTVHSQTVALHHSVGVPEGQAAALTATVYQWRGCLLISRVQFLAAVSKKSAEESEEDDVTAVLHGEDICW